MVHVKKCPLDKRGRPSTEFYINGKPQIYCYGWVDPRYDEPIDECKNCADFVYSEQMQKDFAKMKGGNDEREIIPSTDE